MLSNILLVIVMRFVLVPVVFFTTDLQHCLYSLEEERRRKTKMVMSQKRYVHDKSNQFVLTFNLSTPTGW